MTLDIKKSLSEYKTVSGYVTYFALQLFNVFSYAIKYLFVWAVVELILKTI